MEKQALAAIDLGTNSCRLLITDLDGNKLYKDAVSTRMGENMSLANCFTQEAIKRGIDCFCAFRKKMDEYNIVRYRAIATAACRMAKNGKDFVALVKEKSGINLEVIDGYQEAVLNLKGAMLNLKQEAADYVLVYDLGGGSTEITLATNEQNPQIIHTISIPWGARNSSEKFGLKEYNASAAEKLYKEIAGHVHQFIKDSGWEKYKNQTRVVATSSTPLRLAHIAFGWKTYDRTRADGLKIKTVDYDKAIAKVKQMSCGEMAKDECVGAHRADIFQAAGVIFSCIYKELGVKEIIASFKSAVDGIIGELKNE